MSNLIKLIFLVNTFISLGVYSQSFSNFTINERAFNKLQSKSNIISTSPPLYNEIEQELNSSFDAIQNNLISSSLEQS